MLIRKTLVISWFQNSALVKKLHLVSFNNPYPPDYGGVIDVYYKIIALREAGVSVILHVFEYNRPSSPELEKLCEKVYYYKRNTGLASQISLLPFIVYSRKSKDLLKNLSADEYPVLFEGIHSCFYLDHPLFKNKKKLVRTHNIEHQYYSFLAGSTLNPLNRLYYRIESLRLKRFEKRLGFADHILAISESDAEYFRGIYGKTTLVSAFHPNTTISSSEGKGRYILMHGNLAVEENETAILHCIRNIFNRIDFPVVIAGKNPTERLKAEISVCKNIILSGNPDEAEMTRLQHDAHIHVCYTFQASGLKLKLLNALYKGRFVVANPLMTKGTGLEGLVETGKNDGELLEIIKRLIPLSFETSVKTKRETELKFFGNEVNAAKICKLI